MTLQELRTLIRATFKVVAGGPTNRTRGAGAINVLEAIAVEIDNLKKGGAGGAADKFKADYQFSLGPGEYLGKYSGTMSAPWSGLTAVQAMEDAGRRALYPSYSPASVSLSQSAAVDGEVGESVANQLTGTFSQGDAGALLARRFIINGQERAGSTGNSAPWSQLVPMVRALTPTGMTAVVDYGAGTRKLVPPANTPDDRPFAVRNPNAPQAAEAGLQSSVVYLYGYYKVFFGVAATVPTASSHVRDLPQSQLTTAGNTGILNTGTTATRFVIAPPPGTTLRNVTDLDNQGANITAAYQLLGLIATADASGSNLMARPVYQYLAANPYASSARHLFSYA